MKLFKNKRILGCVYFLNRGDKIGQFLVFLKYDKEKQIYSVLALPDCDPIFISKSEMSKYISDGIIEFVEKLPKPVLNETISEFEHRISLIN